MPRKLQINKTDIHGIALIRFYISSLGTLAGLQLVIEEVAGYIIVKS